MRNPLRTALHQSADRDRATCTSRRERDRFVIVATGELDAATTTGPAFIGTLNSYRADEPVDLVLDLRDVTFVDSPGLAWLMAVRSAANLADRKVRLRSASPAVERVLLLAGLRRYFPDER